MKRTILALFLCGLLLASCRPTPEPTPAPEPTPVPPTATATPVPTPTPLGPRSGWWEEAIFYEVFVRSFQDSDGDGVGDIPGLIERLDYLNDGDPTTDDDLGVTALWLMPVMESPSYHGYDVIDYYTVETDYGTNADFKQLIDEAHRRGINVVIDLVVNHTSSVHPWFLNSSKGDDAEKRDWYLWLEDAPSYQGPWGQKVWYQRGGEWYYAVFWSEMPDLNHENPDVQAEIYDVARYWLEEMGADGFRLDAVRYLIEDDIAEERPALASTVDTLTWLHDFRVFYSSLDPEAMTVGEVWSNSQEVDRYLEAGALDLAFEFDLATAIVEGVTSGSPSPVRQIVPDLIDLYEESDYATFLTNHDQDRVMSRFRGDVDRAKLAAAIYLTMPGVPFIYYGEEIGMEGQKPDEWIRTPMQWSAGEHAGFTTGTPWEPVNDGYQTLNVAAQNGDPQSLLSYYRTLLDLRLAHPALRTGSLTPLESSDRVIYAYLREEDDDRLLIIHNFAAKAREEGELTVADAPLPVGTYDLHDLLSGEAYGTVIVTEAGTFENPWVLPPLAKQQTLVLELSPRR